MGLFDLLKNSKSDAWRDKDGKLVCRGDECPQECDMTCPIWCQSEAFSFLKMGQQEKSIECLKDAIAIAPDFKDAWVNMAAVYGSMGNHLEANKAYKSAYLIDHTYVKAIFGLIISCKNLGQYDEALMYCNEFESLVNKEEADKLRLQVKERQNEGETFGLENDINMAMEIIKHSRKCGILDENENFPHIPEIIVRRKETCDKIYQDLIQQKDGRTPDVWLSWGAYAGMGAVWHWQVDWNHLKANGIAKTLLKPKGSFAMDEYVVDSIGIGFESAEGQDFAHEIYRLSLWVFKEFLEEVPDNQKMQMAHEAMQAMFIFGMVLEMERLGMR